MKKKKQRISDLFYDNRFLFVFSVVLAVVFWLIVVISLGVEVENTVDKIPVQIDYSKIESDFGLKPYGETSFTVDVTIRGKKYVVESDDVYDDIRPLSKDVSVIKALTRSSNIAQSLRLMPSRSARLSRL